MKPIFGYTFIKIGYREGAKLVDSVSGTMQKATEMATMIGLTVVGALVATVVSAKTTFVFTNGGLSVDIQTKILDQIMPSMIPLALVAMTYWLLGRKKLNSTRVIFILLGLSIILYNLHILG